MESTRWPESLFLLHQRELVESNCYSNLTFRTIFAAKRRCCIAQSSNQYDSCFFMMDQRDSFKNHILQLSSALVILTFLASLLRFFVRAKSRVSFSADDYWLVASLMTFYGYTGILLWSRWQAEYSSTLSNKSSLVTTRIGYPEALETQRMSLQELIHKVN